ncbi:MAG: polyketide cyclase [Xanthomonadales bacterium]|nr:polyketide cyclase [Xanthomonadales bacterium]
MMRFLEFIVALIIVALAAVVFGVLSPSSGHVERSVTVGKDLRQVYDVLDNMRRLPDYATLRADDRNIKFELSGKPFGPGGEIRWTSNSERVGNGSLTIVSADPKFNEVDDSTTNATIVWKLDNDWRGHDKEFTLGLARDGSRGQLTELTMAYDVKYGWNLMDRFSNLYIHGKPDSFIQGALNNLQNVVAAIPNVDYSGLTPAIVQTKPQPVLMISTSAPRSGGLEAQHDAITAAIGVIQAEAKTLKVNIVGPRIVTTTNYGDQTYSFDVALPIDTNTLTLTKDGEPQELTPPTPPSLNAPAEPASAASGPESAGSSAVAEAAPVVGSRDQRGRLVLGNGVLGELALGDNTLTAPWTGTFAGVATIRDQLRAYAQTHGYAFDVVVHPPYDIQTGVDVVGPQGDLISKERYQIYLPLESAPAQTPEQEAGLVPEPAPASTAAPAEAAPVAGNANGKKANGKKGGAKK